MRIIAETGKMNAAAREGQHSLAIAHRDRCPKGQLDRASRFGVISRIAISQVRRGIINRVKQIRMDPFTFTNTSGISV